ncbi:hypothetical protein QYF36_001322 [Acer negundo]|nr:hypothetical protein QYF36_001322 [Acer negundo]
MMSHLSSQATIAFVHKDKGDSLKTNNIHEQREMVQRCQDHHTEFHDCNHDRHYRLTINGSSKDVNRDKGDTLNTNNIHEQRNGSMMPTSANLVYTHHREVYDCNHDHLDRQFDITDYQSTAAVRKSTEVMLVQS